ncbi:MAG: O-antigen ligase family protein [Elusimicrobia bacterium]|nr:O-antigen ligase family protein [Elusimicrobiota bacterium]
MIWFNLKLIHKNLIFLFLLVPTLFYTGTYDPFIIKKFLALIFIFLGSWLWIIRQLENKIPFQKPSLLIPLILFLSSVILSAKNALYPALIFDYFLWTLALGLLYLLSSQINNQNIKENLFFTIALATAISGIYGAFQHFGFDFVPWTKKWDARPGSTFGNPNFAAGWWILTTPIFLALSLKQRQEKRSHLFFSLTALIGLLNLYWSRTEGACLALLLSLILGIGFYLTYVKKEKNKFLMPAYFLICIIILSGLSLWIIQEWKKRMQDQSLRERIFKWETAKEIIKANPVFGVGANHLKVHFALYQAEVKKRMRIQLISTSESNVHNEFLQIWAELGILGLFSFLLIFIQWFWKMIKSLNNQKEKLLENIGLLTSLLSFLFYSLTNFPFHHVPTACLSFFILGINESAINNLPLIKNEKTISQNIFLKISGIFLFGLLFIKWILPAFKADLFRLKGENAFLSKDFETAVQFYKKAIRLDFYHSERTAYSLAESLRAQGKINEALEAYQISAALRNYGEVYNNIGNCYYLLRNKNAAIENWKKAIQLGLPDENAQKQAEENLKIILENN